MNTDTIVKLLALVTDGHPYREKLLPYMAEKIIQVRDYDSLALDPRNEKFYYKLREELRKRE